MSLLFTSGSQRIGGFSISPSDEYSGLIFFRTDCFDQILTVSQPPIPLARVLAQGTQHIRVHSGPACWRRKLLEFLRLFTQTQNLNAMYKVRINPFYQNLFSLLASLTVGTIILII